MKSAKYSIISVQILIVMILSACSVTENFAHSSFGKSHESETTYVSEIVIPSTNSSTVTVKSESNFKQLESIAISNGTLSVYRTGDDIYDFVYSVDGKEEQVWSVTSGMSHCVKHFENDTNFLIVYGTVMGHGCPANIVTVIDGKLCVLSEYSDSDELPRLYYDPNGKIICQRGTGVTIGSNNAIPYYWDSVKKDFFPYAINKIGLDELKSLDKENIVPDPESAVSIYRRDNGLVHVNYSCVANIFQEINDDTLREKTASKTYVETENGLREYNYETDACYGFFLECIAVTE